MPRLRGLPQDQAPKRTTVSAGDEPSGEAGPDITAGLEPEPDSDMAATAAHERIYQEAIARLALIDRQWRQVLDEIAGPGRQE